MLSSISPVGEHARRQRFGVTATAYLLGSAVGGGALGALLGAVGGAVFDGIDVRWRLAALAALAILGLVLDATSGVPSLHRQVDERWLTRYRGWVYGAGFGLQLGTGVMTIIPASVVHVMWLGAVLAGGSGGLGSIGSGSIGPGSGGAASAGLGSIGGGAVAGGVVGLTFAVLRALPLIASGRVRSVAALRRVLAGVDRLRRPAATGVAVAQMAVAVVAILASLTV